LKLKISNEKISDKDIDVIDIQDNHIEVTDKMNVNFICKCSIKGNVFFPRIHVEDENTKKNFCLDKILNFYCVDKFI